jgi:hypothetical protein
MRTKGRVVHVTLRSGSPAGWNASQSVTIFTEKDLPGRDDLKNLSEIGLFARSRRFNYGHDRSRHGSRRSETPERFFAMSKDVDGAAAESHAGVPTVVYHFLGDAKFAAFLKTQPVEYWTMVWNSIAVPTATSAASAQESAEFRRHND